MYTDIFTHRGFYAKKKFTYRCFAQRCFLLACINKGAKAFLHTELFPQRRLHRTIFKQFLFVHRKTLIQRNPYTQTAPRNFHAPKFSHAQILPTGRGVCPPADPANINPLERLTILLLLEFHFGFLQIVKPRGPMEQLTIFLPGFHLGFIEVKTPPGPMEQSTIFLLRFHLRFMQFLRFLQFQNKSEREKADMHEVRRGFTFPTDFSENLTWNIVTQKCTKVKKHCALLR